METSTIHDQVSGRSLSPLFSRGRRELSGQPCTKMIGPISIRYGVTVELKSVGFAEWPTPMTNDAPNRSCAWGKGRRPL
jgi:hypothetical protein